LEAISSNVLCGTLANKDYNGYDPRIMPKIPFPEVHRASLDDKPLLANLMQLFLHDFSEFTTDQSDAGDIDENGLFEYKYFDAYWQEENREPLLIRFQKRPIGFALINNWSALNRRADYSVAEFFVLRKYRKAGLGTQAAVSIITNRPGDWEIPINQNNTPALSFWRAVVKQLPECAFKEETGDGRNWAGTVLCGHNGGCSSQN